LILCSFVTFFTFNFQASNMNFINGFIAHIAQFCKQWNIFPKLKWSFFNKWNEKCIMYP
jgi:hypothetical protein